MRSLVVVGVSVVVEEEVVLQVWVHELVVVVVVVDTMAAVVVVGTVEEGEGEQVESRTVVAEELLEHIQMKQGGWQQEPMGEEVMQNTME